MIFPALLLVCVAILSYIAIVQPWSLRQTSLPLAVGDVASQDLRAPYALEYISQVRTEAARVEAERSVAPVYAQPDPNIGRVQLDELNTALEAITAIRDNEELSLEDKTWQLESLEGFDLQGATVESILLFSPERWDTVQVSAINLLAEVMRNEIRTNEVDLVKNSLPGLVSLRLTENEATLVVELVSPLIVPNSFYSPELTEIARQAAREAVESVLQSFASGQTIVSQGDVITATDFEALSEFGLVRPPSRVLDYLGAAALVILGTIVVAIYYKRRPVPFLRDLRSLVVLSLLFLIFLAGARILLPDRTVLPYFYPLPAFALLVCALFGMESGILLSIIMAAFAAYGLPASMGLFPYFLFSSLSGVLAQGATRRVTSFLLAALALVGSAGAMVIGFRLPFLETDLVGITTLAGAAILYGVASASAALLLQYWLAQFLGLTTPMQLLDISRPDAPLLKYFLQRAPGTYQHSLQVANLAEQAAERIGADTLLTRVGALYHDVGKSANPLYFIENQPVNMIDSHEDSDPVESAETIIRHVTDGLKLARKYHLPRRVIDFMLEHHGTLITRYQYNRAVKAADGDASQVDKERFRYPGPTPRSKETAILMLADGAEARVRAEQPQDDHAIEAIVRAVIQKALEENQFDHAPLTQQDLRGIRESFVNTLRTTFHPRLEYPRDLPAARDIPTSPILERPRKKK